MNSFENFNYNKLSNSNVMIKRNHPYKWHDQSGYESSAPTLKVINNKNNEKLDDQSNIVINKGQKLVVGSVEQVVRWCRLLSFIEPTRIIYQVFGIIDSVKPSNNKCEKIFCLRSENKNSRIVCVFYEIDRTIPNILKGTLVLCSGHVKGKNKLQIFTIKELHKDNRSSFDRVSLVSQWAVNDILMYKKM